jgi:putative protease
MDDITRMNPGNIRLDFAVETSSQMKQLLEIFIDTMQDKKKASEDIGEYTTGHVKRGVD